MSILVVEDNPADFELLVMGLSRRNIDFSVQLVQRAEDALLLLSKVYPLPSLMVVDINLPGKSGIELVQAVRENPTYDNIRVMVFTSNEDEESLIQSLTKGANAFTRKRAGVEGFLGALKELGIPIPD